MISAAPDCTNRLATVRNLGSGIRMVGVSAGRRRQGSGTSDDDDRAWSEGTAARRPLRLLRSRA
jgi:hypothetical protein